MRALLIECALALAIAAIVAPGVIWWIGTFIGVFTTTWEAMR